MVQTNAQTKLSVAIRALDRQGIIDARNAPKRAVSEILGREVITISQEEILINGMPSINVDHDGPYFFVYNNKANGKGISSFGGI